MGGRSYSRPPCPWKTTTRRNGSPRGSWKRNCVSIRKRSRWCSAAAGGSKDAGSSAPRAEGSNRMTVDEQFAYLTKGCVDVVKADELRAKLDRFAKTGKPLRVKVGFDPTAPDLHLGH